MVRVNSNGRETTLGVQLAPGLLVKGRHHINMSVWFLIWGGNAYAWLWVFVTFQKAAVFLVQATQHCIPRTVWLIVKLLWMLKFFKAYKMSAFKFYQFFFTYCQTTMKRNFCSSWGKLGDFVLPVPQPCVPLSPSLLMDGVSSRSPGLAKSALQFLGWSLHAYQGKTESDHCGCRRTSQWLK